MEKLKHPISKYFTYVKLFNDDLQNIIDILKSENFKQIELITNTHKLSCDEFFQTKDFNSLCEITSFEPVDISTKFNEHGVEIHSSSDTTIIEGLIQKIGAIINNRKRKIVAILDKSNYEAWLPSVLIVFPGVILLWKKIITIPMFLIYSAAVIVVYIFIVMMVVRNKKNIIYNYNFNDKKSFWARKKDDIMVNIICIIITATLTIIITKIVG